MAWAIVSDIHGNLPALEAVLGEMGEVDGFLCLGDVVGYGAEPEECCRRIRELEPLVLLKGNHEAGVLGELPLSWFGHSALLALVWTQATLSQETLDFLSTFSLRTTLGESMAPRPETPNERPPRAAAGDVLLLHGALTEPFDYVDSTWKADEIFRQTEATLCFLGHTHFAGWFELPQRRVGADGLVRPAISPNVGAEPACGGRSRTVSATRKPRKRRRLRFGAITGMAGGQSESRWTACPQGGLLKLEKGRRYVINCGSVGQPRDGNPMAAFGLFDPAKGRVEFRRVGYDIIAAQESIRRAGLPQALAERLAYGL